MKIYKLEVELGDYKSIQLKNKERNFLREFKKRILSGKVQNGELDNLEIEIVEGDICCDLPKFWSCSGTLVFSERAKRCLENILNSSVEFIPVKLQDANFYIVNIICIEDVIDYDKIEFRTLDTGLIVGINKYSFIEDKVKNLSMFKVMLNNRIYSTEIYVTSEIKKIVENENLQGFTFVEVWNSDN